MLPACRQSPSGASILTLLPLTGKDDSIDNQLSSRYRTPMPQTSESDILPAPPGPEQLLEENELILLVDDYPDIVLLLRDFFRNQGFSVKTVSSAGELRRTIREETVALALLDIGLPDADGCQLLPEIKRESPDTAIIMLTAVTDLQIALECLRQGADDYLTKPVDFNELLKTVRKILEKRRLTINNRSYQRQLEQAHFRLKLLHELTMKMNTAYLTMVELDEILLAILVGITAEEGLQFNRAFLALFDENGETLEGRMAIGPGCREEAGRIWQEMRDRDLRFHKIIDRIREHCFPGDAEVNRIVRALRVDSADADHILIRATRERQPINVVNGECGYPVSPELIGLLQTDSFVIVPLFSPSRSLGVLIADHFVTGKPITPGMIEALESFASQASLAIEHCRLYMAMEKKIRQLETMAEELEKNKDLLLEAERYSAIGHMAAQLAHSIRNPITSIGGTARLLARKTEDPQWLKFLNMMTREAAKIEATLEDLFSFVEQIKPVKEEVPLHALIQKSVMLHYPSMQKQGVEHQLLLDEKNEPVLHIDPRLISQVLVHLIRNSVEAMPKGGKLILEVRKLEDVVEIYVRDTGSGITEINIDRITDPFFTTKTFGTGMGLALVKRIVKDHGGSLDIRNREQGGTEVCVTLPLGRTDQAGTMESG